MGNPEARTRWPEDPVEFRAAVRRWYRTHGRDLPWRGESDAYRVWIREIMLQQTTVAAVVPYLNRFFEQFPTVRTVAAAREADVLKQWEGLGYYSRARNIHKAARLVVERFRGRVPVSVEHLQELPGIGRYTASAIASFAGGASVGIVEANTLRLYSRLMAFAQNPRSAGGQRAMWEFAEHIVPARQSGSFNQALMDLGSTICTPTEPDCHRCPVMSHCRAFRSGLQHGLPALPQRAAVTNLTEVSQVIRKKHQILLRQRGVDERWAGLWDFVRFEVDDTLSVELLPTAKFSGRAGSDERSLSGLPRGLSHELSLQAEERTGLRISAWQSLTEITHSVTRYRIRLLCFTGQVDGGRMIRSQGFRWVTGRELSDLPLSKTARQIADLL